MKGLVGPIQLFAVKVVAIGVQPRFHIFYNLNLLVALFDSAASSDSRDGPVARFHDGADSAPPAFQCSVSAAGSCVSSMATLA